MTLKSMQTVSIFKYALISMFVFAIIGCVPSNQTNKARCLIEGLKNSSDCVIDFFLNAKTYFERETLNFETIEAIHENPCLLAKISWFLGFRNVRFISSIGHAHFENKTKSCKGLDGRPIRTSLFLIESVEDKFDSLRKVAGSLFSRDFHSFVVLCSNMCSSFVINLANRMGYVSGNYLWFALVVPDFMSKMTYPKNQIVVTSSEKVLASNTSNFKKSGHTQLSFQFFNGAVQDSKFEIFHSNLTDDQILPCLILKEFSKLARQPTLKVSVKLSKLTSHPELLNLFDMTCQHGLLCWVFDSKDRQERVERKPSCCLGFVSDLLIMLREDMHVDLHLYEIKDNRYGDFENGSWNGLIGDVISGKADIGADFLMISKSRLGAVDFTESFHNGRIAITSVVQVSSLPILNVEAFSAIPTKLWLLILGITFVTSAIIYWSERCVSFNSHDHEKHCWVETFTYAMGLLLQRDIAGSLPNNLGSRTTSISLAFALMIIMSTYTALLTSRNISNEKKLPISGFGDPKVQEATSAFTFGTLKNSYYSDFFENNENSTWRNVGMFMRPYNVDSTSGGFKALANGILDAFITSEGAIRYQRKSNNYCDVDIAGVLSRVYYGFALPKDSSWTETINHFIRKYKENGKLSYIESKYFASKCSMQTSTNAEQFGILYLSGACALIAVGFMLSVVVFVFELLIVNIRA